MILLDSLENFDQVASEILSYIEGKHWGDLTLEEINLIQDRNKRIEYRRNFKNCFMCLINPLYTGIKNKSKFSFSNPDNLLTCRNMVKDLLDYYYKKGYTRDEIIVIASDYDIKKKY